MVRLLFVTLANLSFIFINNLSIELKLSYPNMKGFSVRNLKNMRKYYLICSKNVCKC